MSTRDVPHRIIMGAQACGFGPVAKLSTISRLLPDTEKVFIGDGIALDFALRNNTCFSQIIASDPETFARIRDTLADCSFGLVVMHHELAFWIAKLARPLYFFDSLFGFWVVDHEWTDLIRAAEKIRQTPMVQAHRLFHQFSVHEQKILAHLLSTRSFVQAFPGVHERVEELRHHGVDHIAIIGSIALDSSATEDALPTSGDRWEMLINLGGVQNFLLEFHRNDYYIDLIEKWVRDFVSKRQDCRKVTICCGRYTDPCIEHIGNSTVRFELLPHDRFLDQMKRTDVYVSSPGLTALHEAVQIGRVPVLLPEQHFSQLHNLQKIYSTRLGCLTLGFDRFIANYAVPVDDLVGSEAIVEYTRAVLDSPDLFRRFANLLLESVERSRHLALDEHQHILGEMRQLLSGPSLGTVVLELLEAEVDV